MGLNSESFHPCDHCDSKIHGFSRLRPYLLMWSHNWGGIWGIIWQDENCTLEALIILLNPGFSVNCGNGKSIESSAICQRQIIYSLPQFSQYLAIFSYTLGDIWWRKEFLPAPLLSVKLRQKNLLVSSIERGEEVVVGRSGLLSDSLIRLCQIW